MGKGFSLSIIMAKSISLNETMHRRFFLLDVGRSVVLKTSHYRVNKVYSINFV